MNNNIPSKKIKVLYIVGTGRSGSTLLGNMLGEVDNFLSVGELIQFWEQGFTENRSCGCGLPIKSCEFWQAVLFDKTFSSLIDNELDKIITEKQFTANKYLILLLFPWWKKNVISHMSKFSSYVYELYRTLQEQTGCGVIVDSSKNTLLALFLSLNPQIDFYVVHLVRDSRGVAYSWQKQKIVDIYRNRMFKRKSWMKSSLLWLLVNLYSQIYFQRKMPDRYIRQNYEDFVANPNQSIDRILSIINEESRVRPQIEARKTHLNVHHTVGGNPSRFSSGEIELRIDDAWEAEFKRTQALLTTALTAPLLLQYKYPLLNFMKINTKGD